MTTRGPTGIYWGELPCRGGFSGTATMGWEPAVYTIQCLASDVVEWLVKHDPERFRDLGGAPIAPQIAAALTAEAPKRFVPSLPRVPYRADLFVREVRDGKPALELPVRDLFLTEARVLDEFDPPRIELVLADVRKFWPDYGELTQDFNVPVGADAAGKILYSPASLIFGGETWTTSKLVARCLNALPGQVQIAYFPPFLDPVVRPLKCVGASPLEVAKQAVADARLTFGLNLDQTAALWPAGGIGALGETPGGVGTFNSATYDPKRGEGVWKGEVLRSLIGRRLVHDAPDEVVIVGPPPVNTIRVDYLEPVLPYDEPQVDGGSIRKLLPVTPALLEDLVKVFSSPAFRGTPVAVEPPKPAPAPTRPLRPQGVGIGRLTRVVIQPPAALQPSATKVGRDQRAILLRAPFLGDEWPSSLDFLPRALRDLLADRLWRFWRVPDRWSRFLPVLDRAETVNGVRLPPTVEAFTYRQVTAQVAEGENLDGVEPDMRSADELELQAVEAELGRVRHSIAAQTVNAKDLEKAYEEITKSLPDIQKTAATLEKQGLPANAALIVAAAGFLPKTAEVATALLQKSPALLAQVLGLQNPGDFDPLGKKIDELKAVEAGLVTQRANLLAKTSPVKAAEERVLAIVRQINEEQGSTGIVSTALEAALGKAQTELRALRASKPLAAKRTVTVLRHLPAPRGRVEAIVGRDGLVETAEVVGWPSDMGRADLRETYLVPLPVSLTFGSHALPDSRAEPLPPLPTGTVSDNAFIQAGVDLLANNSELRFYAAGLGHIVPKEPGKALRLTFSRADRDTGQAVVGPWPYRVTLRAEDPRGQVLVELRQSPTKSGEVERIGNTGEVRAHCKTISDALFQIPQVVDAGSIEILGPRPVNVDMKTTAVRWASDALGNVNTTVYVDPVVEAVPGFPVDLPLSGAGPSVFGVDLGAT